MIKAVLFDLDETILDRTGSLVDFVTWQTQGMLRSEIENAENIQYFINRFIELDANGTVWKDKVYETLINEFSIQRWSASELLLSYELCFCGFCKPKMGVIAAVKTIKKMGLKLALVSNGKSPFQERNFYALGVSQLFDTIIVSEAVGLRKPQEEIFELACNALEVKTEESLFVGDNPHADIAGANNAGMYSVYIPGHYGDRCDSANAVCRDFQNLPDIVANADRY